MKINNGQNPLIKIGSIDRRTPSEIAAIVAIRGAIDRISHVTLFGFHSHLMIFLIYMMMPKNCIATPRMTRYCRIVSGPIKMFLVSDDDYPEDDDCYTEQYDHDEHLLSLCIGRMRYCIIFFLVGCCRCVECKFFGEFVMFICRSSWVGGIIFSDDLGDGFSDDLVLRYVFSR